ncbi:MAG: hypothetical protein WCJ62_13795 [Flavobacterium sp.]
MSKQKIFSRGNVILTNLSNGYFGIAVVLSEREKTSEFLAKCHIAITPLLSEKEIKFEEIDLKYLKPFYKTVNYNLKNIPEFSTQELTIGVYNRRNKMNLKIIGNIDPNLVYEGPLPFEPFYDLEIKWPIYGDFEESSANAALQKLNTE